MLENLLEGLQEPPKSCYSHGCGLFHERTKTRNGRRKGAWGGSQEAQPRGGRFQGAGADSTQFF